MLYRAFAYIRESTADEVVVFFDAPTHERAMAALPQLLSTVWSVPADQVEFYNLASELELLRSALGPSPDGEVRLFETGWVGEALYSPAARTYLLVHPQRLATLQRALQVAEGRRLMQQARDRRRPAAAHCLEATR